LNQRKAPLTRTADIARAAEHTEEVTQAVERAGV